MSYMAIAAPAMMLGLFVAVLSLLLLCFTVPVFTLKVEKVIYSNLAQLVANRIDREHEISIPGREPVTVFAQDAQVHPAEPGKPSVVTLTAPMIVMYEKRSGDQPLVPREFWMASVADAHIQEGVNGQENSLTVVLNNGVRLPRQVKGGFQGGVQATQFGPVPLPSTLRENTKFMDIRELRRLYRFPGESRRMQAIIGELTVNQQHRMFLDRLQKQLAAEGGACTLKTAGQSPETYTVGPGAGTVTRRGDSLIVTAADRQAPNLQFLQQRGDQAVVSATAREIQIQPKADPANQRFLITVVLLEAQVRTGSLVTPRASFSRSFAVPMPESIASVRSRTVDDYLADPNLPASARARLQRELVFIGNRVQSEMHSRTSFAISCLILVMVGCALGMMLKSGDFLSAFAVSFIPALVSISLIIAGQQICEHVPDTLEGYTNPIRMGLALIWSGNVVNLALATFLLGRLQRQ